MCMNTCFCEYVSESVSCIIFVLFLVYIRGQPVSFSDWKVTS